MPDQSGTQQLVLRYLQARVPLIVIQSIEPGRVMELVADCASVLPSMPFFEHSRTEGLREMRTGAAVSDEMSLASAMESARTTFKSRPRANFIFTDIEDIDQESSTARHVAEMVRLAESREGSIVLISSKPVWTGLGRLGMTERLDLPTTDELTVVIDAMLGDHNTIPIEWGPQEIRQAAETLTGITEAEAVNVLASLLASGRLSTSDLPELSRFKDRIFGDLAGIERVRLDRAYQVGGLRTLRTWLDERRPLMRMDLSQQTVGPPRGVLLVGVPGCGKSLSAKAIAHDWDLPLYRLDLAAVLGMWMGQSETQLREALETADRVAPCVLWIDEIEKAFATSASDNSTTRRLLGQFLFWLQESRSKVFIVATANQVTSLPPELLRKGRFDEMFFVDLPTANDREDIIRLYFRSYLQVDPSPTLVDTLVSITEGFSGSDLDAVVKGLQQRRLINGGTLPTDDEIQLRFQDVIPFSMTNPEDLAEIRLWGATRCKPAGDLPPDPGSGFARRRVIL